MHLAAVTLGSSAGCRAASTWGVESPSKKAIIRMDFMAAQTAWPDAGLSVWLDAGLDPWLERRIEAASFSTVILPEVENPISETLPDLLSNPDAKFNNPFPRFQEHIARSVFRLKVISFSALTMCRKNKN